MNILCTKILFDKLNDIYEIAQFISKAEVHNHCIISLPSVGTSSINFTLHNGREEMREARKRRTGRIEVCLVSALVHTNFLIPPRSLASGCVTGAYATRCIHRVCASFSSPPASLFLSRRPFRAHSSTLVTRYVYLHKRSPVLYELF